MSLFVSLLEAMSGFTIAMGNILSWGYEVSLGGQTYYISLLGLFTAPTIFFLLTLKLLKMIPGA